MRIGIEGHNLEQSRWGVGYIISNILTEFGTNKKLSNEFEIFVYFHKKIPDFDFLNHPNIKPRLIKPPLFKNVTSLNLFYHILLPFAVKKDKVDIMYYPSYLMPILFLMPGSHRYFNYKKIVALHDISYKAHPQWFRPERLLNYRLSLFNAVRNADRILTISKFSKREILKYYPQLKANRVFVDYVAPKPLYKRTKTNILKTLGVQNKFILFVGQITTRRRVRESIIAFRKIGAKFPEYQFLIVGYDRTYPYYDLKQLISETNKILKRTAVIHTDYIEFDKDIVHIYKKADLFLYISSYEGFGMPPLEVMAYGTPTVLKNSPLTKEVFENAAFLVDNERNPEEIALVIEEGLTNKQKRKEIIEKGLHVAQKYTWSDHVTRLANLFREITDT